MNQEAKLDVSHLIDRRDIIRDLLKVGEVAYKLPNSSMVLKIDNPELLGLFQREVNEYFKECKRGEQ